MATGVQGKLLKSAITKIIFSCNAMQNFFRWSERCTLTISHLVFFKVIKISIFQPTDIPFKWAYTPFSSFIWKWRSSAFLLKTSRKSRGVRHEREGVNGACSVMQKSAWLLITGLWKATASFNNVSWAQEVTSMTSYKICCRLHVPPLRFNVNKVIPTVKWGRTSSTTGPNSSS